MRQTKIITFIIVNLNFLSVLFETKAWVSTEKLLLAFHGNKIAQVIEASYLRKLGQFFSFNFVKLIEDSEKYTRIS